MTSTFLNFAFLHLVHTSLEVSPSGGGAFPRVAGGSRGSESYRGDQGGAVTSDCCSKTRSLGRDGGRGTEVSPSPSFRRGASTLPKGARLLVVVLMRGWGWGGGGGWEERGRRRRRRQRRWQKKSRCKGEHSGALTNAQRMPVNIHPSADWDERQRGPGVCGARLQSETQRPAAK